MVDMDDPETVLAIGGNFGGAMTAMTGGFGSTADRLVLECKGDSPVDSVTTTRLDWIRDTFADAITEACRQAGITVRANDFAVKTIDNNDIDGGNTISSAAV
ncbi:hypothetical protein [Nocardia sp. NPDC024068]|uniref:hypothetical protein n=1 Tax=Nocardia sp. NPDC024068 TaxID=3157197 RepID=UPI0033FDB872